MLLTVEYAGLPLAIVGQTVTMVHTPQTDSLAVQQEYMNVDHDLLF